MPKVWFKIFKLRKPIWNWFTNLLLWCWPMLSCLASYQVTFWWRVIVCVCPACYLRPNSLYYTQTDSRSLPPLPIWSKGSGVATVLMMTLINVCAWCPHAPPFLYCSSLWLDLWPGHLTFPVLTAPRSPSCEIDSVCVRAHLCSGYILQELCALWI